VAAYASIVTRSVSQSTDEIRTPHGMAFCDLETGAFYLQTQLLQVVSMDGLFSNFMKFASKQHI